MNKKPVKSMPKTAKQSVAARGDNPIIKLRSDVVSSGDLAYSLIWVHNGRYYSQVAPVDKDIVGIKYGMFISCTRSPKHPVKNVRIPARVKK